MTDNKEEKKPAETNTETKTKKNEMSFLQRIQSVRVKLLENKLTKTGKNKFSNYDYFELGDFTPEADKLFLDNKIFPWFTLEITPEIISKKSKQDGLFDYEYQPKEYAVLTLYDMESDKSVESRCTTVEATTKGASEIQNAGAKHTYYRRYLYIDALNLAESDGVDSGENEPVGNVRNVKDVPAKAVSPKPAPEPVKEIKKTPVEAANEGFVDGNSSNAKEENAELMSQETKNEIMAYIKSKNGNLSVKDAIDKVAKEIDIDKVWFRECDKDGIIKAIDTLDSLNEL